MVPEEAEIVKRIFTMYRDGYSLSEITNTLNAEGLKPMYADQFHITTISRILDNITYTGNLLLQKYYTTDPVSGKLKKNKGELPQYFSEETHEAIISMELYEAVQKQKKRMQKVLGSEHYETWAFSRKIVCSHCGRAHVRVHSSRASHSYYYWKCWKKKEGGVKACSCRSLREDWLENLCCQVLGMETFDKDSFREKVDKIINYDDYLEFHFSDGRVEEVHDA